MSVLNKIQLTKLQYLTISWVIISIAIFGLLLKFQILEIDSYKAISEARTKVQTIPSIRGSILDRYGSTLVYSEPRYDVYVWKDDLIGREKINKQTRQEFISKVSTVLVIDPTELGKKLDDGRWIKIGDKITVEQQKQLLNLKTDVGEKQLAGMQYIYANKRIYPEGKLASQVLGFVTSSERLDGYKGVWGLEQFWDGILKPQEGYQAGEYDGFGNLIALSQQERIESKPGATIKTTIDKNLQAILEKNLQKGYDAFKPKSATGIIMDPKTGEILALANYPDFDPNEYAKVENPDYLGNLAVTTPYEIGSVGKVFSLSAAIDLGKVNKDTIILPEGHQGCEVISPDPVPLAACKSPEKYGTKIVDCICTAEKKAINKPISITDAIKNSDNIAFRHIAMTMEYEEFYNYLIAFGVGSPTKIDLSGESVGVITKFEDWNYADQATYSYGHGYSVTPIEAIAGVAAVANNGIRMQPFVVKELVGSKPFTPKEVASVMKPETADTMTYLMNQVYLTQLKEARYKYLSNYYVGLKSGTALIPFKDRAGYSDKITTTYVGFDASPDRKFIMLIKLEEPQVGLLSAQNVRIVWLDTLIDVINEMNVKPYNPFI